MTETMSGSAMQLEDLVSHVLKHAKPDLKGNTGACLVALPRAMDSVRLVGDEDKHATILYFGETSSLPSDAKAVLTETLQNVSRLFMPFSESVQNISRLGSDNPPALVALLSNQMLGKIREASLINPKVGDYLSNATQYPSFTPHITLGYPDYQGEAKIRELATNLYRVRFDRLALWWGEEQIEFSLDASYADSDVPMEHMETVENFLAHFGVKGMKWGVRNDTSGSKASGGTLIKPKRRTAPLLADAGDDLGLKRKAGNYVAVGAGAKVSTLAGQAGAAAALSGHASSTWIAPSGTAVVTASPAATMAATGALFAGSAASIPLALATKAYLQPLSTAYHSSKGEIRRETKALNTKYSSAKLNLRTNKSLQAAYHKEYKKVVETALNRSKSGWTHPFRKLAESRVGKTNANSYKMEFHITPGQTRKPYMTIRGPKGHASAVKLGSFKHDDMGDTDLITSYDVELTYDADGYISDFTIAGIENLTFEEKEVKHAEELVGNFLLHFGVKGMKWGVRRSEARLAKLNTKQAKLSAKAAELEAKQAKLDAAGAKSGGVRISVKKEDGTEEDIHVSADAERFIKTQMKDGVSMSTREIKEAVDRARIVKQYDEIFGKDPNADLRAKADAIELNKKIADLTARPSRLVKVNRLLETSSKGFEAYSKLNKATGGSLNKKMKLEFGQDTSSKLARTIRARETSLYNDIQKTGSVSKALSMKTPRISSSAAKRLAESKSLRDQVDELLRYAEDGSKQGRLF